MNRKISIIALTLILLLVPVSSVFADNAPLDPGVSIGQDSTKPDSVQWLFPNGFIYYIDDEGAVIELDWENVDANSTTAPVEGVVSISETGGIDGQQICGGGNGFEECQTPTDSVILYYPEDLTPGMLGFPIDTGATGYQNDCTKAGNNCEKVEENVQNGGTFTPTNSPNAVVIKAGTQEFFYIPFGMGCDPVNMAYCVDWKADGSITVVRYGEGPDRKEISNIQFWHTEYDLGPQPDPTGNCPDVWVSPGVITASAEQIAPTAALVIGQDPSENGVTLEWHITVEPTVVTFQKWEVIYREVVACMENSPTYSPDNGSCGDDNCGCPTGLHAIIREIWGCKDKEKIYQEGLGDLIAGASLKPGSRAWIEGELKAAYPGARLINPDWAFDVTPECGWLDKVCTMVFSLDIPAADPGWYDIQLKGQTQGTLASPPRSFDVTTGSFGVFLIDNFAMTQ